MASMPLCTKARFSGSKSGGIKESLKISRKKQHNLTNNSKIVKMNLQRNQQFRNKISINKKKLKYNNPKHKKRKRPQNLKNHKKVKSKRKSQGTN